MDDINDDDDDGLKKAKTTKKKQNRIKVEVVIKVKRRKLIRFSFINLEEKKKRFFSFLNCFTYIYCKTKRFNGF